MFGRHTKITTAQSLRPADHICIWDRSRPIDYQHHGIVWEAGESEETIKVVHIWSPLENIREAQADSHFRISPLKDFLDNRKMNDLRLVQYHTSGLRNMVSRWGEVHLSKSDIPEVVQARARFLLGLGKQKFNIITQNCEHAAHWCKTGEQWSKQSLTKGHGKIPFEDMATPETIAKLHIEVQEIKARALRNVEHMIQMTGKDVYLIVNGSLHVTASGKKLQVNHSHDASKKPPTAFRLFSYSKGYNSVKVSFCLPETGQYMYSHSSITCKRKITLTKVGYFQNTHGVKWELSTHGDMQSMHQHRRYIGIRGGILVDVSKREECAQFTIVPAPVVKSEDPLYHCVTPERSNSSIGNYNDIREIINDGSEQRPRFEEELRQCNLQGCPTK